MSSQSPFSSKCRVIWTTNPTLEEPFYQSSPYSNSNWVSYLTPSLVRSDEPRVVNSAVSPIVPTEKENNTAKKRSSFLQLLTSEYVCTGSVSEQSSKGMCHQIKKKKKAPNSASWQELTLHCSARLCIMCWGIKCKNWNPVASFSPACGRIHINIRSIKSSLIIGLKKLRFASLCVHFSALKIYRLGQWKA